MLGNFESHQRLIEKFSLPGRSAFVRIAFMTVNGISHIVNSPVLRALIGKPVPVDSGCVEQGQAQGTVIGFVGAELAILQNGNSVFSAFIREVKPFFRRHFKLFLVVVAAADGAYAQVVGCFFVGYSKRE